MNISTLVALLLMSFPLPDLCAQDSPYDPAFAREASRITEQVVIFTDRSLYITGEEILFAGRICQSGLSGDRPWSSVLYVELVTVAGRQLGRAKYPVNQGKFSGAMNVPEGLLTGGYYLRSYTRWMRNRGPATYSYVPVRIVNPVNEHLELEPEREGPVSVFSEPVVREGPVAFRPHPGRYGRGDSVSVTLYLHQGIQKEQEGCLVVVPRVAVPAPLRRVKETEPDAPFRVSYLPDLDGITLSGSVVLADEQQQFVPGHRIHLTLFGNQPDYLVSQSDGLGRFIVALPDRVGTLELFIQPEDSEGVRTEVRIEQDFDPRQLQLPVNAFQIADSQLPEVTSMARKTQLSRIFGNPGPEATKPEPVRSPFYGTPSFRLNLDDFVLLPTMEETFINLVPVVTPVHHRRSVSFVIHGQNPALRLYPPLIMIDEVPVFDAARILSVAPADVAMIDVVNDVYLKGGTRFGGIINLRTREGDMTGLDIAENSFFFDYVAFRRPSPPEQGRPSSRRNPDTRNTVLWIPELDVGKGPPVEITFPAPDYPGTYAVVYRGVNEEGEVMEAETSFLVE